ncbi:hypothetical protein ILYODFUR_028044 [Ilyodon furcidens]|uniref:Uncharacterized protein n=1 Tax=Ilyodon furcidens TaxID=33524 RepID=A0ABV0UY81_9TELE
MSLLFHCGFTKQNPVNYTIQRLKEEAADAGLETADASLQEQQTMTVCAVDETLEIIQEERVLFLYSGVTEGVC